MADFHHYCSRLSELTPDAADELFHNISIRTFEKGDYLLKSGRVCRNLFFVQEGLAKIFSVKDDKEFTMRFFAEDVLFTAFDSYLTQAPSKFNIVALELTTVTVIAQEKMNELCRKHHCMETFFRKLVSIANLKMTKRISEMLEESASVRYEQFVSDHNDIVHRISLGDLAKYLGITQQSLSRIRAHS